MTAEITFSTSRDESLLGVVSANSKLRWPTVGGGGVVFLGLLVPVALLFCTTVHSLSGRGGGAAAAAKVFLGGEGGEGFLAEGVGVGSGVARRGGRGRQLGGLRSDSFTTCVISYLYPATCSLKGYGSGSAAAKATAVGFFNSHILSQTSLACHSRAPLSPSPQSLHPSLPPLLHPPPTPPPICGAG